MLTLLVLHHIAETIQPSWLIKNKSKYGFAVYEHSIVWAGIVSLGLYILGTFSIEKFVFLLVGHFIIDYYKYRYFKKYEWVYLDQFLHYSQLYLVL